MSLPHPIRTLLGVLCSLVLALALVAPANAATTAADPRDGKQTEGVTAEPAATLPGGPAGTTVDCVDGQAGPFPCENVDLASIVSLPELGGGTGSDIWGWTDPQTGSEYALMTTSNGTAFVDVTMPESPRVVGQMPTQSALTLPLWRDVKVFGNYAFVVSEHDDHGMQIFDLTRLRDPLVTPAVFTPDAVYDGFSSAHNVAVNEETGFAYAVGTDTCEGGLHMIDINDPANTAFAGCFAEDGYTHDAECEIYRGKDGRFKGREICFAFNEDTVTIVDVTDKANPTQLSRTGYPTAAYTHQGATTPDDRFLLFNDELDESNNTVTNTTTYIMALDRLDQPGAVTPFSHETESIDHNLYIEDGRVWESNYTAGLRILDYDNKGLAAGNLTEVGFFDVQPATDVDEFAGTWSNYPYFDSGTVVVSSLEGGLFVLQPDLPTAGKTGKSKMAGIRSR